MDWNKVSLAGRLTKDPFVGKTKDDKSFARFTLAISNVYKGKKTTAFVNVTAFGKVAENAEKFLAKGDNIYIDGRLSNYITNVNGKTINILTVIVNLMFFLERRTGVPQPVETEEDLQLDDLDYAEDIAL